MKLDKDKTITISLSTAVSVVTTFVALYAFAAPLAERALAVEMQEQIEPLTIAFEALLVQNIHNQRNAITALEFKRDTCAPPPECWTLRDAQDLESAKATLRSTEQALAGIRRR